MKQFITFFSSTIIVVFAAGCSAVLDDQESFNNTTVKTKSTLSQNRYVYNSTVKAWMFQQEDPYRLSEIISIAEHAGKNKDEVITPTHYALKLYPRDESELNELLLMNDTFVSYIPFSYSYVPTDDTINLSSAMDPEMVYSEEVRYYVDKESAQGRQPLPVLYARWDALKPLPAKYDYEIEYEACLPSAVKTDTLSFGQSIANSLRGSSFRTVSGYVKDYDDLLDRYVPVSNVKVRITYGLSSIEAYTNSSGYFMITGNINDNANVQIIYENSQWRISNSSLFTYITTKGTVSDIWGTGTYHVFYENSVASVLHRGAHFFFNGNHGITTPASSYSLRINMISSGEPGSFTASLLSTPWIEVTVASYNNDADYVDNVLHELGHFNHYQINNGFLGYADVHKLIKESYAEFIAWHMCWEYYKGLNSGMIESNWRLYLSSPNQLWKKTESLDLGCYSPLFIDLVDNENQKVSYGNQYNNDLISGISPSNMPDILEGNKTWDEFKSSLTSFLSANYSSYMIAEFFAPYDYFISNN